VQIILVRRSSKKEPLSHVSNEITHRENSVVGFVNSKGPASGRGISPMPSD
jgi:hypothetical protein